MIDIKVLLYICEITYTAKQLLKLEKFVNDFLQQQINKAISNFGCDDATSEFDGKSENESLGIEPKKDLSNKFAVKIEGVNLFDEDRLLIKPEISEENKADIKTEGLTHEVN